MLHNKRRYGDTKVKDTIMCSAILEKFASLSSNETHLLVHRLTSRDGKTDVTLV